MVEFAPLYKPVWEMALKLIFMNPYPAKLIYLNFHTLLQVDENYSYLFFFSTNICKSWCLDTHFLPNNSALGNPFNPEFTIVIFIHYKPQIAAAILDL